MRILRKEFAASRSGAVNFHDVLLCIAMSCCWRELICDLRFARSGHSTNARRRSRAHLRGILLSGGAGCPKNTSANFR